MDEMNIPKGQREQIYCFNIKTKYAEMCCAVAVQNLARCLSGTENLEPPGLVK